MGRYCTRLLINQQVKEPRRPFGRSAVAVEWGDRRENPVLAPMWNLSAAVRGYMRYYMPTNIAIDLLRTRCALGWATLSALAGTTVYLSGMSLCATLVERGGPGWLNVLVMLSFWNAIKFAWGALLLLIAWAANSFRTSLPV